MKFERTSVMNLENAIHGMRNPKNSWAQSDSYKRTYIRNDGLLDIDYVIGKKDMELAKKLIRAGSDHRKFLRQILVSVDITAPRYWWSEADTYKVGTVANSTSTMHKLATTPITLECFEIGDYQPEFSLEDDGVHKLIDWLENLRIKYNKTKENAYWKELIRWLPASWLQTRTVTLNYENLYNMYHARKNHKLTEWSEIFSRWVKTLPYAKEFIIGE